MKSEQQSTLFPAGKSNSHPGADVEIIETEGRGLVVSLGIDANDEATKIVRSFLGSPRAKTEDEEKKRIQRLIEDLRHAGASVAHIPQSPERNRRGNKAADKAE